MFWAHNLSRLQAPIWDHGPAYSSRVREEGKRVPNSNLKIWQNSFSELYMCTTFFCDEFCRTMGAKHFSELYGNTEGKG